MRETFLAIFIILTVGASVAQAESCSAALERFNAGVARHNLRYANAVMKEFGVPDKNLPDPKTSKECRRWLPIYYHGKADYPSLRPLEQQRDSACKSVRFVDRDHDLKDLSHSVDAAEQKNRRLIDKCEEIIAAAPAITAPTVSVDVKSSVKSTSCGSDITGTNSTAPAATACKDGFASLRAARITRKKYGVYAQEQYKKAAASFRLAGDIGGAEAAEREARLADDVFDAQQKDAERAIDAKKQQAEGEATQKIAEKIEEGAFEDGSCADLEVAASYYRDAARAFLNADVYDKASLAVQRDVRLGKIVKQAQAEGRCDRKLSKADRKSLHPPNGGDELADDPHDCAGMRARLTPAAPNQAWIDDQMSRSNCHPDGTPMTLRERLKAALEKANP